MTSIEIPISLFRQHRFDSESYGAGAQVSNMPIPDLRCCQILACTRTDTQKIKMRTSARVLLSLS